VTGGDQRRRFLIESAGVRGELVRLDAGLREAMARTEYPDSVRELLSEAFVAANLLTGTLKFDGRLTLQVRGPGDLHLLVVQVTSAGTFRGLARWRDVPPADAPLERVFGADARMVITIEVEQQVEPYQGIVVLEGASLAEAIGRYFRDSEQLDTTLQVSRHGTIVSGLLLQRLPAIEEGRALSDEAARDGWRRVRALAATVEPAEMAALPVPDLLHRLFHEETVRLFDAEPLRFGCGCSRERTDGMLLGLGRAEVDETLAEQGQIEITCEFCDAQYRYDLVDVEALFLAGGSGGSGASSEDDDTADGPTRH